MNIGSSLAGTPSYPVDALCYGDLAALGLWGWPFYTSEQLVVDTDFGVGQLRALSLSLVVAELVSLLALPYPHHQGELSSTVPARPVLLLLCQSQLHCTASQATGTTPHPHPKCCSLQGTGSALPLIPSGLAQRCLYQQGQLHRVVQEKRRAHSPKCGRQ